MDTTVETKYGNNNELIAKTPGGGRIKMGLSLHTTKFHFYLMCSPLCVLYLVIEFIWSLCRKRCFLRYRQLEVDGFLCTIRNRHINIL